jgi:Zn-dependent protease with chaperone function
MKCIKYVLFSVIFLYSSMWTAVSLSLSGIGQGKVPVTIVENATISKQILDKTGVHIKKINISESPRLFGMMIGIPSFPQLVLSRGLYESFGQNEMEYVVLHETGHYVLWHSVIEGVVGLLLFVIGVMVLNNIKDIRFFLFGSIIIGLVCGIIMIQLGKIHEIQADTFTVERMSDPNGMIEASNKFKNYHGKKYTNNDNPILQFLFYRSNPYENRIKIAKDELQRRLK